MDAIVPILTPSGGPPAGSPFPLAEPVAAYHGPPLLAVVVDAEEEFEWAVPLAPQHRGTVSIRAQRNAHTLFAYYGIKPTYLVTYPLAAEDSAIGVLREYLADGLCEIGAQLHPWVTPPFSQGVTEVQSYPGNLPVEVEREKLSRLVGAIETAFALQPTAYKAGRYGFGPNTSALLEDAGFEVDTSLIPRTSYADSGGPDFNGYDYQPFWFGHRRRLLELPVTRALAGSMAQRWPRVYQRADRPPLRSLHAGGLLARAGLLERITLSPEGSDLAAMCRLTRVLLARGTRLLTLSYHSPSLEPGHTPYVRNERDLAIFLDRLSGFLSFFRDEIGGEFLTLADLRLRLLPDGAIAAPAPAQAAPVGVQAIPPAPDNRSRCLIVANTFPPVVGGSAVAYDNQARFAQGRISVLAPYDDYRNGWPTIGWREYDRIVPYPIHRIRLLRTPLLPDAPSAIQRLVAAARDVAIRISVLRAIRRIGRAENIDVVCIGELVASGWLATACRVLLRLKSLIYIHGEEISTRMSYDEMGRRRRRAISRTDGVVAVSPFTRGMLMTMMGVPEAKIQLITPGIDVRRFSPRPPRADLVARYGIAGKTVLLTVGRLFARKGMDRMIESLPQIRPVIENICYLVVGDGPYRSVLEDLAACHGVKDAVVFAGTVPENELIDHYALADIFVMANREMPDGDTEGFGLVFLEANACGIPVIAGKAGGSVDAVTDLRNGLVVDGRDPADITAAVIRLCQNDTLRAQLRETGLEIAAGASWESRSDLLLGFCDQLIAGKR